MACGIIFQAFGAAYKKLYWYVLILVFGCVSMLDERWRPRRSILLEEKTSRSILRDTRATVGQGEHTIGEGHLH